MAIVSVLSTFTQTPSISKSLDCTLTAPTRSVKVYDRTRDKNPVRGNSPLLVSLVEILDLASHRYPRTFLPSRFRLSSWSIVTVTVDDKVYTTYLSQRVTGSGKLIN